MIGAVVVTGTACSFFSSAFLFSSLALAVFKPPSVIREVFLDFRLFLFALKALGIRSLERIVLTVLVTFLSIFPATLSSSCLTVALLLLSILSPVPSA